MQGKSAGKRALLAGAVFLAMGVLALYSTVPADHQAQQTRPIELGTSGGSVNDLDMPYCCGGTLGALLEDAGGVQYIVSNNHVIARSNRAALGEDIIQPGLIDVGCSQAPGREVADLTNYVPIRFDVNNLVDAAIARVRSGAVETDGSVLGIGKLNSAIANPTVGQSVKKAGRTTGVTTGAVAAVDVSVSVRYSNRCGRGGGSVANFLEQVRITPGDFSAGGDSGSVIVENVTSNPRALALLFAGSSTSTFANLMANVLGEFNAANTVGSVSYSVAMVGGTAPPPPPPATGTISGTVTSADGGGAISGATVSTDTGQSATTAGNGSYTLSDVPTGTRTVTASATGFQSASQQVNVTEGATATANLSLTPLTAAGSTLVQCITYTTSGGRLGDRHLTITASVRDDLGNPVSGASVTMAIERGGQPWTTVTASTNSSGNASITANNAQDACYRTNVTNVVANGLTWSGTQPQNGFAKGFDSSPDADCLDGSTDCGSAAFAPLRQLPPERVRGAIEVKQRHEAFLRGRSADVIGVGVGARGDDAVIEVYLRAGTPQAFRSLPARLNGVRVVPVVIGEVVALPGSASCRE
jgi:hypothetical protein